MASRLSVTLGPRPASTISDDLPAGVGGGEQSEGGRPAQAVARPQEPVEEGDDGAAGEELEGDERAADRADGPVHAQQDVRGGLPERDGHGKAHARGGDELAVGGVAVAVDGAEQRGAGEELHRRPRRDAELHEGAAVGCEDGVLSSFKWPNEVVFIGLTTQTSGCSNLFYTLDDLMVQPHQSPCSRKKEQGWHQVEL